jgi:hypothetical protein
VFDRRAGADLGARLLDCGGRGAGPTRRSWRREGPMRSLGRRCRVRSAARTERTRVALGRLRHEVMGAMCCSNVLPGAVACTPALRAASAATSLLPAARKPCRGGLRWRSRYA